jgi:hypothetical protein
MRFLREILDAFRHVLGGESAQHGGGRTGGRNPWPQCTACFRRVPALCTDAEEGAEPCFLGVTCGCCTGPHRAPSSAQDGGKFTTSVEKA